MWSRGWRGSVSGVFHRTLLQPANMQVTFNHCRWKYNGALMFSPLTFRPSDNSIRTRFVVWWLSPKNVLSPLLLRPRNDESKKFFIHLFCRVDKMSQWHPPNFKFTLGPNVIVCLDIPEGVFSFFRKSWRNANVCMYHKNVCFFHLHIIKQKTQKLAN
jgi:hypothetical protein